MLHDPVRNHPVGCIGCRFTLEETDCSYHMVPGIKDVIRHKTRRFADNRTKTCLNFLCRLVNLLMPRFDGVLPYRCVHGLLLSQFDTFTLEKMYSLTGRTTWRYFAS